MKNCNNRVLLIQPVLTDIDGITPGFITWTEDITYHNNIISLPDGTNFDCKIWLNNQHQFDNGSYTHFLLDYYNDNII